jgi:hypothetical protein
MNANLMPHQVKAVNELRNGNILKGGVGSGKSRTALAYYNDVETVTEDLYVITTAKKRDSGDWEAEAELFGLHPRVDSWNNLAKYENVEGAFFIFDEQRVVGTGAWVQAFLKITKKNRWILLSATPGDTWMDYIPIFLANGLYRTRAEFLREHVVFNSWAKFPKVERYIGTAKLAYLLKKITVNMVYDTPAERKVIDVFVEYDHDLFEKVWSQRWNYLEDRPIRNIAEMCLLARRVCNSDPSRIQRVRDLMVLHPRLIIFYSFDYELEKLRELAITTNLAEWNGHKHQPIPDADEWIYLVHYLSGSEGWNCIETDAMIFFSLSYSYRQTEQAKGRIDRMTQLSDTVTYYILKSTSKIDNGIARALEEKRDFNEAEYVRRNV